MPRIPRIILFKRKQYPGKYFSIEILFNELVKNLPSDMEYVQYGSKRFSKGIIDRFMNMIDANRHQGDVNHVTGDEHFLTILMRKSKNILTIHDCRFLMHPNPLARIILKFFWLTLPLKRVRYITAVSEKTKQEILSNARFQPERIMVIPNFVFGYFQRNNKPFEQQEPVILQVGTTYNKNLEMVAEALCGIRCKLIIIGKPSESQLKALDENNINYRYFFEVSNEDVFKKYCEADMVMFISTLEGFGLPIIEANAVGRPIITSNIEPMTSVAGDSACFVDPYDVNAVRNGVIRIINDRFYREELVHKGLENVKRFRVEEVAKMYHQLYQRVLDENNQLN
jgi:glycosyltransferase involved in cell wall biosynthesis